MFTLAERENPRSAPTLHKYDSALEYEYPMLTDPTYPRPGKDGVAYGVTALAGMAVFALK
jgi:hypothetical protein